MNNTLYIDNFTFWRESAEQTSPDVSFVAPILRRRLGILEKIAISLAHTTIPENMKPRIVFASQFGEWEQTIKLIRQFNTDKEMSPAGFSNSVHNAAMGHLSLLMKNTNSYTSIAGAQKTIEMGLLDAITGEKPVLFIYGEERNPEEYKGILHHPIISHGCAILISNTGENRYELIPEKNICPALGFDELEKSLNSKSDIKASDWTLAKK